MMWKYWDMYIIREENTIKKFVSLMIVMATADT